MLRTGRLAGAVNAVRCDAEGRLAGALFDGEGLVDSLNGFNIAYTGKRVLILARDRGAAAIAVCWSPGFPRVEGRGRRSGPVRPDAGQRSALARRLARLAGRVLAVDKQ